jgi:hypothetical protein
MLTSGVYVVIRRLLGQQHDGISNHVAVGTGVADRNCNRLTFRHFELTERREGTVDRRLLALVDAQLFLGAAILDQKEPTKVIGRAGIPILAPREDYERIGDVPNVVFATGAFIKNEKNLVIFYGAANSCICIGTTTVEAVVESCMESEREY